MSKGFFLFDALCFKEDNVSPQAHHDIMDMVFKPGNRFKSIECSRGLGKSTLVSTKLPLYLGAMGQSSYALIVSDTASQAESIISDMESLYLSSEVLASSMVLVRSVADELQFRTASGGMFYVVGKGSGAKLRGIKRNRRRPDLIIMDDLSNDDIASNPARREKLKRWVFKALLPSREPTGYLVVSVFTPLHRGDVAVELHSRDYVDSISIPLANELPPQWDTMESAWPDRFPISYIKDTYHQYTESGRISEFMQEHFLQLVSDEDRVFDPDKIQFSTTKLTRSAMVYVTTDLAISQSSTADRSVICVVAFDEGLWKLLDVLSGRWTPTEMMDELFRVNKRYKPLAVGVETVGYQASFSHHLRQEMMNRDEYLTIRELKQNTHVSKVGRIMGLTSVINTGNLLVNEKLLGSPALDRLMEQVELTSRDGVLSSHDDELDALASMVQLKPVETYQEQTYTLEGEYDEYA
ncbi:MAG: hypothetical protein JHC33_06715 [Ignisphaera sp.]|nr:hypothetical protein [Ignisphaera sp.]